VLKEGKLGLRERHRLSAEIFSLVRRIPSVGAVLLIEDGRESLLSVLDEVLSLSVVPPTSSSLITHACLSTLLALVSSLAPSPSLAVGPSSLATS